MRRIVILLVILAFGWILSTYWRGSNSSEATAEAEQNVLAPSDTQQQEVVKQMANYLEKNQNSPLLGESVSTAPVPTPTQLVETRQDIPPELIQEIEQMKGSKAEMNQDETTRREEIVKKFYGVLEGVETTSIETRKKLLEMSMDFAQSRPSESTKDLLFHQADRYLASSNTEVDELGKKAFHYYMNIETDSALLHQRRQMLLERKGVDPF